MTELELNARALVEAAGSTDVEDLRPACAGMIQAAAQAPWEDLHGAVTVLARGLQVPDLERAAALAVTCGALVERGAHPEIPTNAILKRLQDALPGALRLIQLASKAAPGDEIEDAVFDQVRRENPAETRAWDAVDNLGLAAIACLSRREALRKQALSDKVLVDAVAPLADVHPRMHFLALLLRVLDGQELVVLHPPTKQGWRVEVSGVADNFQLQTLLADLLVGKDFGLPGTPPPREVVDVMSGEGPQRIEASVAGGWNLYQWNIIQPDGSLPPPEDTFALRDRWVWGEGAPDDLERFEGRRTLVLGPATMKRQWNASRIFPALQASVELVETLAPAAVEQLLSRMGAAVPRNA